MRITDLENGARAVAQSAPAVETTVVGAKCYVRSARGNSAGGTATLTGDHEIGAFVGRMGAEAGNIGFSTKTSPTLKANMSTETVYTTSSKNGTESTYAKRTVRRKYIVRRLTPLECCRLQGFPDGWGDIPTLETMTDEDAAFWEGVRRTHAEIMGKKYAKAKTKAALVSWYNKLHTDSAEYKMWGNGIALPCAVFVLGGVVDAMQIDR